MCINILLLSLFFQLIDCLRTTFVEPVITDQEQDQTVIQLIERSNSELQVVEDGERSNVKIGAKIFLNNNSTDNLKWALSQLYRALNVEHLDNLILAYHPKQQSSGATTNGNVEHVKSKATENQQSTTEQIFEWGNGQATAQADLIALWRVLEEYATNKKINQLGIADLDLTTLKALYDSATVRPTIAQINLQACCVVPPSLQEFCNVNDVQLLTHSDPEGS